MEESNLSTFVNSYFLGIDAEILREMIIRTGKDMEMLPDDPTKARYVVEYALLFAFCGPFGLSKKSNFGTDEYYSIRDLLPTVNKRHWLRLCNAVVSAAKRVDNSLVPIDYKTKRNNNK
ncbi:hypothetical protein ACTFIW_013107 [Dictyostelium discoideum]